MTQKSFRAKHPNMTIEIMPAGVAPGVNLQIITRTGQTGLADHLTEAEAVELRDWLIARYPLGPAATVAATDTQH